MGWIGCTGGTGGKGETGWTGPPGVAAMGPPQWMQKRLALGTAPPQARQKTVSAEAGGVKETGGGKGVLTAAGGGMGKAMLAETGGAGKGELAPAAPTFCQLSCRTGVPQRRQACIALLTDAPQVAQIVLPAGAGGGADATGLPQVVQNCSPSISWLPQWEQAIIVSSFDFNTRLYDGGENAFLGLYSRAVARESTPPLPLPEHKASSLLDDARSGEASTLKVTSG